MTPLKKWIDVVSVRKLISSKTYAIIKTIQPVIEIYSIAAQVGPSNAPEGKKVEYYTTKMTLSLFF